MRLKFLQFGKFSKEEIAEHRTEILRMYQVTEEEVKQHGDLDA